MKKLLLIFCCTVFFSSNALSQDQHLIDSLNTQLKQLRGEKAELRNNMSGIKDSSTAKILNALCWAYFNNNPEKAMDYGKQALTLSEQIGWKKGIGITYNSIGVVFKSQGNYPEALKNCFASLKINEEIGNKKGMSNAYSNIGSVYLYQSNYPEALKNHFSALKIYEETKDKRRIAGSYNNIGNVYQNQGNYPEALKNYFAALKINEETGNKDWLANNYGNIGIVYESQGNYPEALKSYFAALKILEEFGDKKGITISYNNIGEIYTQWNRAKEGKAWLQKGLTLSMAIGAKEDIKESYSALVLADSALGNYKGAFENHKMYMLYKDSLLNEENIKKQTQTEMQYEFDKKETLAKAEQEKKDAIAQEEKEQQQLIIYSVSGGLILVLLLVVFIFRGYRLVGQQKLLVEEKHKEITDSINYAERIQRSFLAAKGLLDENLKDYFVFFKPKDVVSGDFYWAAKLSNGNFALATADSTGHGVPGAIMSLLNITSLEKAIENNVQPSDILNTTRNTIIERLKKDGSVEGGKDGMDASLTVYDFKNKKLIIAAANNPVWIVRASGVETRAVAEALEATGADFSRASTSGVLEIKPDKMPVGKHDKQDISFTQQEIELQSGDVIYTLTDGFSDQFGGEKSKKFMSKNLREFLAANSHLPMQEQKQLLETTFKTWVGDLEQVDDVTLIGVRISI